MTTNRKAFKRDETTRDFIVSGNALSVVYGIDVVLQNCDHAMRQQLLELQYNQEKGIEYFGNVFNGTPNYQLFKYQAITQLENVSGVERVSAFTYNIENNVLSYSAEIVTEYGIGTINGIV
jgi:hypothetical protein